MPAAVNTVGAKGSADSSTSLTTSSVTPTGSNTAVLVFTLGESTGYSSGSNFNSSGGTAINDFTSADVHLNVATNFRQAYAKIFGEVASPTSSTAIYSAFPAAGNSIVVESVFLDTVNQSTPFGTEQVSAETGLSGTQSISQGFTGLTSGQLVVGALFIQDFAGSASTATANSGTTIQDMITSPGPENDVLTIYVVSTTADGSGNATLSLDATSTAAFSCARVWGIPVAAAAGGATHTSTGALVAGSATIAGTAAHQHASTGALIASAATIAGTATHTPLAASHPSSGALVAGSATIAGTAAHLTLHTSSGALVDSAATISGTTTHLTTHATSGALVASSALLNGTAAGPGGGTGAEISGFWYEKWAEKHRKKPKVTPVPETIEEAVEFIQKEVKAAKSPKAKQVIARHTPSNLDQQIEIAEKMLKMMQDRDIEDEDFLLLF